MKICQYCDAENDDEAKQCAYCGASKFRIKCGSCGNVFETGAYCPQCGVKVGQKPKKCPVCGSEYYSNACPNCGYLSAGANYVRETSPENDMVITVRKKRRTWLWVLGWMFIFPLPLTILINRSEKMNKFVKIALIIAVWLIYLGIGFSGEQ